MEIIKKIFLVIWEIIKWIFVTSWRLNMILFALVDLWLGDGSWWRSLTASKNTDIDREFYDRLQRDITRSNTDTIIKKYGEVLEKYVASESTTSIEARILEKLKNSPGKLPEEILSKQEMAILFEMIVRAFRASGIS